MGPDNKPPTPWNYFLAFFQNWLIGMSGPLSVVFSIATLFLPGALPRLAFAVMAIFCWALSSYLVWRSERQACLGLMKRMKEFELPPDRPKISFLKWGEVHLEDIPANHHGAMEFQRGFYLSNDGGVALEVKVRDFSIADVQIKCNSIPRIEGNSRGFVPMWVEGVSPLFRWDLVQPLIRAAEKEQNAREMRIGSEYRVHVEVTYRDFGNLWYSSESELIFHPVSGRIEFAPVIQRQLGLKVQLSG